MRNTSKDDLVILKQKISKELQKGNTGEEVVVKALGDNSENLKLFKEYDFKGRLLEECIVELVFSRLYALIALKRLGIDPDISIDSIQDAIKFSNNKWEKIKSYLSIQMIEFGDFDVSLIINNANKMVLDTYDRSNYDYRVYGSYSFNRFALQSRVSNLLFDNYGIK